MIELLTDPHVWAALATLTVLEIVLGIDNLIFISILVARLPAEKAEFARKLGLGMALLFRVMLLFALTWIMGLTQPVLEVFGFSFSWRDLILLGGGLFLIAKATHEIHLEVDAEEDDHKSGEGAARVSSAFVITQIILIDIVFSLDSILTAIGLAEQIEVMITAVVIAMVIMYAASGPVSDFIKKHPTTKMLALAFLFMIGAALIADAFHVHIPRGYIYTAMAFSAFVELFNILAKANRERKKKNAATASAAKGG
jgi:predicted tellurium resistance membrane protein TerC